jgi:CPA1 family monovalent cation:H+ antiporter
VSSIPYPIWLVLGGAVIGFVPGIPDVQLDPAVVLVLILPPLLYSAAFFSSLRDLQANLREISLLAIGCVLFTMVGVAVVAHEAIGLSWPVAFVLGAVLSPTDPVAATAIGRRVGAPARVITIVEGEALVNDATALVAFKFATVAVVTGSFSLWDASGRFVLNVVVGIAIGLAVGVLIGNVRRRVQDAPTEITISLVTPYFAYLPAEALGVSAVLAAVTAGIYLGWNSPRLITAETRIQAFAVWSVLAFLLNAALFTLLGLQLPSVLDGISGMSAGVLVRDVAIVAGTVILIRFLWVLPATYLPWVLWPRAREHERERYPSWRPIVLVAWNGMRGAVSLAAALAIPLTVEGGGPFPDRDLVIFLVYATILATLLLQGLSLPYLIRWLGIDGDGEEKAAMLESKARLKAADAALERLEQVRGEDWVRDETYDRVRALYNYRRQRFASRFDGDGAESEAYESRAGDYTRLMDELLTAQRERIIGLRREGRISDDIMHRIERDLDLEDSRLGEARIRF